METETLPAPVPATLNGNHAPALVQPSSNALSMPVPVQAVIARYDAIQEIVRGVFKEDVHFGKIPGTGDKKTLLKPGFDALCTAFQFSPDFVKQPESVESAEFINLVYKCVLTSATGRVIATGIGSCNSKEEKYRWKPGVKRACPACGKTDSLLKSKKDPEWFCWAKKDGCGATFPLNDSRITGQKVEREENDNAWNHHNTLTKMAQKRAGMAAIITACGISGDFTQDVEDFDPPANDKRARGDEGIDIVGQGPAGYENPNFRTPPESSYSMGFGEDAPPQEWRDELEGGAKAAEDAVFTPAAPGLPADIAEALQVIRGELKVCTEKKHFQALKVFMQSRGGAYLDPRVTGEVNVAYATRFPAKSTTTPPAAP